MNILIAHNFYQQPGGEDQVFAAESALLEARGHHVIRFTVHNDIIPDLPRFGLAPRMLWNRQAAAELATLTRRHRIDVAHFHNTFPLLSPAVYRAVRQSGAAVVQTLHNFRLLCPGAFFFRDGKVCLDCLGRLPIPGIIHRCYRNSFVNSAALTTMIGVHRALRTWKRHVDRYIVLAEFARRLFVRGGLPAARIAVKPNFLSPDPGAGAGAGGYALFVGRLSAEKGIDVLLRAAPSIARRMPLWIVGNGPLVEQVRTLADAEPNIRYLGQQPRARVQELMADARVLVSSSVWFEAGIQRTLIESFAAGTPVAAFDIGGSAALRGADTGAIIVPLGDAQALADAALEAADRPAMRDAARAQYLRHYTPGANYDRLMEIYRQAIASRTGAYDSVSSSGRISGSSGSTRS